MPNTALHPANIINNQSNTHVHIFICHVLLMQQLKTDHVMCIKVLMCVIQLQRDGWTHDEN